MKKLVNVLILERDNMKKVFERNIKVFSLLLNVDNFRD